MTKGKWYGRIIKLSREGGSLLEAKKGILKIKQCKVKYKEELYQTRYKIPEEYTVKTTVSGMTRL